VLRALLVPLTLLAPESAPDLEEAGARAVAVLRSIEGLDLRSADPPPAPGMSRAAARAGLDRAREAFRTLALDDSIREATAVADGFPFTDAASPDGARLLREAFVRIAIAHQAGGRPDEYASALARAAGVGLADALPLADFPPPVVGEYETQKRRLLAAPRLRVEVRTEPAGAEVLVDGLTAERAADGAVEALATPHVLTARWPGRGTAALPIEADSTTATLSIPRPDLEVGQVRLEVETTGEAITIRLTARLGAGEPVVFEETGAVVEVAARRAGEALRDRTSPRPDPAVAAAPTAAPRPPRPAGPRPFYDRWWFWAVAGGAVVAGAAIASVAAGEPQSDVYVVGARSANP
jgi:hypothetical protein